MFENAIALTGGIASGKSTVSTFLKMYGYSIIDADKISHKLLDESAKEIAKLFGDRFLKLNSKVDRKALGELIFSNSNQKERLESLLHPKIRVEIERESIKLERFKLPYFIDIPLFFEKKSYPIEKSLLIYTPKKLQIQRLIERDKFSKEMALKRINSQMDIEKKRELSTYIIDNSLDIKHLQKECEEFIEKIK